MVSFLYAIESKGTLALDARSVTIHLSSARFVPLKINRNYSCIKFVKRKFLRKNYWLRINLSDKIWLNFSFYVTTSSIATVVVSLIFLHKFLIRYIDYTVRWKEKKKLFDVRLAIYHILVCSDRKSNFDDCSGLRNRYLPYGFHNDAIIIVLPCY